MTGFVSGSQGPRMAVHHKKKNYPFFVSTRRKERRSSLSQKPKNQATSCVSLGQIGFCLLILEYGITISNQTIHMWWNGYYEVNHNVHFIVSKLWIYLFLQELQVI